MTREMRQNWTPHSKNLRKGRSSEIGRYYALTKCTHGREPLFQPGTLGTPAAEKVIECLHAVQRRGQWAALACVVMPDHVHAVVRLKEGELSEAVKLFSMYSSNKINQILHRRGPVWQHGFYDHALRGPISLQAYLQYMVQNPVRAGLVKEAREWPFLVGLS
jgi:putative transposase